MHDPSLLPHTALAAVTVYLALHHFALWAGRRGAPMHGWIAAWCVGSFVVAASRIAHYSTPDPETAVLALRVTTAATVPLAVLLVGFCRELGGRPVTPRGLRAMALVLAPLVVAVLVTDLFVSGAAEWRVGPLGTAFWWVHPGPLLPALGPAALLLLGYCIRLLLRAADLATTSRRALLGGLTLYALLGVNDLVLAMGLLPSVPLFEFSFAVLAVVFDFISVRWVHDLHHAMESRVAERTASLAIANASLEQALHDTQAATDAKSAFLANMSHEIRTPMNGVMGMTALLMDTRLTPEQHGYAATIRDSADALLTIVNDILDFSKIEAGRLALEDAAFDSWLVTEEVVHLLSERAREQGVGLACEVEGDVPRWVRGDPGRIRLVLVTLVGNAIKFTNEGSVFVKLSCPQTEGQEHLRFEVIDTGIGIEPARLASVFDPFSQGDSSTTRKYGGTGLGLAICKQLAELMAGELGGTSEPGVGSTFWFTLALRRETDRSQAHRSGQLVSGRALVASSNHGAARMLRYQLASYGLTVDIVGVGAVAPQIAQAAAEGQHYRFAFLDRSGSGRAESDDLAACLAAPARLRIVWLTDPADAAGSIPRGVSGRLTLPTRRDRVADLIGIFSDRSSEPSIRTQPPPGTLDVLDDVPRRRVLVAEDNPVNQRVARRMLESLGWEVQVVSTGREAVAAVSTEKFDVVLMDCQMPDLDGYDATTAIRSGPCPRPRLPIIAMTASATPDDERRCLAVGMNDFLTKPFRPKDLKDKVDRWSRRSAEDAA